MKQSRKIVILVHSLQVGGTERVVSEIANRIVAKPGYSVHIVLIGLAPTLHYTIDKNVVIHFPSKKNHNRTLLAVQRMLFIRRTLRSIQPDTVVSFGEFWNNLVLLATRGLGYPIYIADRSQPLISLGKLHNKLRKLLYPKATGLIVQTERAKELYKKQFKNLSISVVPNPIKDIDLSLASSRENKILMVARFIETKHQDRLIKIFSKINKPNWILEFVGGDALKQKNTAKLNQLIRDLELKDRVRIAGTQAQVDSYYLSSKIFAFTSSSEGFPNVIGEAMKAGLPVIAYDCDAGPSDLIVDGENGFLIPLFDDDTFAEKLHLLMEDDQLITTLGANAQKHIERFNTNDLCDMILNSILAHELVSKT